MHHASLADIFSNFDGTRLTEETLPATFRSIAEQLICNGYFMVNNERKIYLTDVEFYYHEEDGAPTINGRKCIKDPIMYHTYDHEKTATAIKEKASLLPEADKDKAMPYFKPGTLNLHASGIDITFENEAKKYRASVLIRGYQVDNRMEHRSTYIYEDMFMNLPLPLNVEWVAEQHPTHQLSESAYTRQNVAAYYENGEKIPGSKGDPESFYYNGNYYKQCQRKWRFKRQD